MTYSPNAWAGRVPLASPLRMCDRGPGIVSDNALKCDRGHTDTTGGWGHLFVQLGKYLVNIR